MSLPLNEEQMGASYPTPPSFFKDLNPCLLLLFSLLFEKCCFKLLYFELSNVSQYFYVVWCCIYLCSCLRALGAFVGPSTGIGLIEYPLDAQQTTGLEPFQVRIMPEFAENDDFALEPI